VYTYILLFLIIIYLLAVLYAVRGDYIHPCAIILEVYLLSVFFLVTEIKKWEAYISEGTFSIIFLGLTVYIIVAIVTTEFSKVRFKFTSHKTKIQKNKSHINEQREVDIVEPINLIFNLLAISVVFVTYRDIANIAASIGSFSEFGKMVSIFHTAAVRGELERGVSKFSSYGSTILTAISYIYLYIVIQNIILRKRKKKIWYAIRIFPIIMYMLYSIIIGSRNPILQLFFAGITIAFIMRRKYYLKDRKFEIYSAIKIVIFGSIVLFAFSNIREIVGRTSDLDTWDYIAKYVGAPIKLFDMLVLSGNHNTSGIWGKETFINIWRFIGQKIGNQTLANLLMNKEWRTINGFSLGNVYTAFREYYYDFGITGVVILTAIHSFIFNNVYRKLNSRQHRISPSTIDFSILLYAYFAQCLFYFSIDDRFYQAYLSYGTLRTIIVMLIFVKVIPKIKIRENKRTR